MKHHRCDLNCWCGQPGPEIVTFKLSRSLRHVHRCAKHARELRAAIDEGRRRGVHPKGEG